MLASPQSKKKRLRPSRSLSKPTPSTSVTKSPDFKEPRPYFTYSELPFCLFCKRTSAPLVKLPSGIFINITGYVHEICLKNKGCCECGVLGLCYRCTFKDCLRLIHFWCGLNLHGNANYCDLHSSSQRKKESSRASFIKSICRKVIGSSLWEKEYKDKDSPASLCNGNIFWYIVSLEYFPLGVDLSIFPVFPLCSQFSVEYENSPDSVDYVEKMTEKVSKELEKSQKNNERIVEEIMKNLRNLGDDKQRIGEGFLEIIESGSAKEAAVESVDMNNSTKSEEGLCGICGESKDLDPLLSCKMCFLTVHSKCYRVIYCEDFVCEVCLNGNSSISCILCPKAGGILRKTLHAVKDLQFKIPSLANQDYKSQIWVHCFCALHTPGVVLRNQSIDLLGIDDSRLNIQCEICNNKEGYCLQCSFPQCVTSFHPECGKDLFMSSKSNERKIFCALHKPVKLRKMLENKQKVLLEDLYKFCKAIEKYSTKPKVQVKLVKRKRISKVKNLLGKVFTPDEDLMLEYKIQQFLYKLNLSQKVPFMLNINLNGSTRCSRVNVTRPQMFTLINPSVILEESITIENRSADECFKRYQDTLFSKLKNEMLLLGNKIFIYLGNDVPTVKHYSKPKKRKSGVIKVSSDTYCICNQPYYYEIPWIVDWTQEEWENKVRENEMIECTKCEKWFHLKCVGYEGSLDKAQQDENWKCGLCDKKKTEKEKFLDKGKIISDLKQGVVTRRGTKIN